MAHDPPSPSDSERGESAGLGLLLFVASMATITLQVVQVRILSYTVNHAFVYMAISLAMVGFGASGTFLSIATGLRRIPPRTSVGVCLALFALASLASHAAFGRVSDEVIPERGLSLFSRSALYLLMFALPYFFAGLAVALALLADAKNISTRYFVNLLGSAAGCFAVYPFLGPVGAESIVASISVFAGLAVLVACSGRVRVFGATAVVGSLAVLAARDVVFDFRPDESDQYSYVLRELERQSGLELEATRDFERWDPVGKIELWRFPDPFHLFGGRADSLFYTQDAGAASVLFGVADEPELREALARGTVYGLASRLHPGSDGLVIGLGGGPDLLAVMENGYERVTGVEINAATVGLLGGRYRDFLGFPSEDSDALRLVHADGRSYVRQFQGEFDLVQMSGADTFAASATGGSVLAENYLYSIEAFEDYLNAVKPDGFVAITRFGGESLRVFTTMMEALRRLGVEHPERHIAAVRQGMNARWICILTKRSPLTQEEIADLRTICDESPEFGPLCTVPVYDPIGFSIATPLTLEHYPRAEDGGERLRQFEAMLLADDTANFEPVTDDNPFFFNLLPARPLSWGDLFGSEELRYYEFDLTDYIIIVIQLGLVASLLILGPLLVFRLRGSRLGSTVPLGLYFIGIGTGFMLLEIVLMQKCGLFLGHPNYSISTVLFSLLVASGVGSYASGKSGIDPFKRVTLAIVGIGVWIVLFTAFSQTVFTELLHLPLVLRILTLIAMIAPVGFCVGVPFPTLLSEVEERVPHFSPWAIGANGFASVVSSLGAIPLSMAVGFSMTTYAALASYAVAWLGLLLFKRR